MLRTLQCLPSIAIACVALSTSSGVCASETVDTNDALQKRWLFVWRNMKDPKEVERMISRFPTASAHAYNGVVFQYDIAPEIAPKLQQEAKKYGLDLVAVVMGNAHDRNYVEGLLCQDALFVVHGRQINFEPDNPTKVLNGDFESVTGNHFAEWTMQDDEGVTTFADHEIRHGGSASLRMQNIGKNEHRHCRLSQLIQLKPRRQYCISFWVKTENLEPADPEVKVLTSDGQGALSFQTFHAERTQDWKQYHLVFNGMESKEARLYLGSWYGKEGKLWWDDVRVQEIGLVNVLRRSGCPITVRSEGGTVYEEGKDFEPIVDPELNPWRAYHDAPRIKLTGGSRIADGEKLRVSYYHPLIVYEDRLTSCVSEPRIFEDWRQEVKKADKLYHPAAFLMSHDEMRVMNQCALCQSKKMTPGQLLAWNVRQAAQIIREERPDAEIWVWSDMFDPNHNAVEHYYAVNGSLSGSWEGLDRRIGIMNWHGGLKGKNCQFFADLGLKQILSGYYDSDEDGSAISVWLANTAKVPGIIGAMYTTWEDKYGAMEAWADKAWGGGGQKAVRRPASR